MNIYSQENEKIFSNIVPNRYKNFIDINSNYNNDIYSDLSNPLKNDSQNNKIKHIKKLNYNKTTFGNNNLYYKKRHHKLNSNRHNDIYYNNSKINTFQTKSMDYPLIDVELEFKILKNKIIELNKLSCPKNNINFNKKRYSLQKNKCITDDNINLKEHFKYMNIYEKSILPVNNNINNNKYEQINIKKKQKSKKISNKSELKLNNFTNTMPNLIKEDNFDNNAREKENREEIDDTDDELSELATRIIQTNKYLYENNKKKILNLKNYRNINEYNNIRDNNNINSYKDKKRFLLKKYYSKANFAHPSFKNFSINSVSSLFILNKKENDINKSVNSKITKPKKCDYSIEKLNIEINSNINSKYYENKKILTNLNNYFQRNSLKNEEYNINKNKNIIEYEPSNNFNINLSPKNNKIIKKSNNAELNNINKKVKFDSRILTIYYNLEEKVPNLTIKDNKDRNIEFVPLDMKQYIEILTSNNKLKPCIISKKRKMKKNKTQITNFGKKKDKNILANNSKKIKNEKRDITPDFNTKLKFRLSELKIDKNKDSFKDKSNIDNKHFTNNFNKKRNIFKKISINKFKKIKNIDEPKSKKRLINNN